MRESFHKNLGSQDTRGLQVAIKKKKLNKNFDQNFICHALLLFVQFINRENTFSKVADFSLTKQRKASYILIVGTTIPDGIFGTNPSFRAK